MFDPERLSMLFASVGFDLTIRAYPAGTPIRDAVHLALVGRLKARIHPSIRWRTEVPLPRPADLRGWDAMLWVVRRQVGVEAETRPRDLQALERSLTLKMRDSGVDSVILLLADTRNNRAFVRAMAATTSDRFPVPGRRALELLGVGVHPGGSSIVLL